VVVCKGEAMEEHGDVEHAPISCGRAPLEAKQCPEGGHEHDVVCGEGLGTQGLGAEERRLREPHRRRQSPEWSRTAVSPEQSLQRMIYRAGEEGEHDGCAESASEGHSEGERPHRQQCGKRPRQRRERRAWGLYWHEADGRGDMAPLVAEARLCRSPGDVVRKREEPREPGCGARRARPPREVLAGFCGGEGHADKAYAMGRLTLPPGCLRWPQLGGSCTPGTVQLASRFELGRRIRPARRLWGHSQERWQIPARTWVHRRAAHMLPAI